MVIDMIFVRLLFLHSVQWFKKLFNIRGEHPVTQFLLRLLSVKLILNADIRSRSRYAWPRNALRAYCNLITIDWLLNDILPWPLEPCRFAITQFFVIEQWGRDCFPIMPRRRLNYNYDALFNVACWLFRFSRCERGSNRKSMVSED